MRNQSVIYLNFAPYENAGRILDYLVGKFDRVILFSFSFHRLKNKSNLIRLYSGGKLRQEIKLFELPTPESLLFITLPLIMILIGTQTIWHIVRFRFQYGKFDYYLTVNAFTAWIGNILRGLRIVDTTIFWVWDYYPPGYPDWRIRLARSAYWLFDKWSSTHSSSTIFLNKRLLSLRQKIGVLPSDRKYSVVPIGTNPGEATINKTPILGHMGVLKQSQGLDFVIDYYEQLQKKFPTLKLEIVGSGPDEGHFKDRTRKLNNVKFYGFVKEEDKVDEIIRQWSVGIATYRPDESSPAYWTDPSKIKAYLSQGVPVITTSIATMSQEVTKAGAGEIVTYDNGQELVEAVSQMLKDQKKYKAAALELAKKYNYRQLYDQLFEIK